jgi:hypothetical protein
MADTPETAGTGAVPVAEQPSWVNSIPAVVSEGNIPDGSGSPATQSPAGSHVEAAPEASDEPKA